jgi:tetratricopeptide (TPR) repeat protein
MGGYGALKYSGYLGADAVLAFSPQFSVSPHEAPFDCGRHAFYNAELHSNMAIMEKDVSGKVSIFYDSNIALDRLHALAICAEVNTARLVSAAYSGHDMFRIFQNQTSLTGAIVNTLREANSSQRDYVRRLKKKSDNYYVNLANALVRRGKFSAALRTIDSAFLKFGRRRSLYFAKARALSSKGETEAAFEAFNTGLNLASHPPEQHDLAFGASLASVLGLKSESLHLFRMSVEKNPFRPVHHTLYIDELLEQGQVRDAILAITTALQRFPSNPDLLKRMEKSQTILEQTKKPDRFWSRLFHGSTN